MRRSRLGLIGSLTAGALAAALSAGLAEAEPAPAADPSAARPSSPLERGTPGTWTKISTGTVGIGFQASLWRTGDGVLHVVYPKNIAAPQYGHTAISVTGTTTLQNDVIASGWSNLDSSPIVVGDATTGLRVLFGGIRAGSPGFWSDGRMYTATAPQSGDPWTLPAEAVGASTQAFASYGTAATTLADGTPVAAFPLGGTITWHTGTGSGADESFTVADGSVYDLAMVRDGADVWLGWYGDGGSGGTYVRRIKPTLGPIIKAPGSTIERTGRVALAARAGGGVYAAYCAGTPPCPAVKLWKVGTTTPRTVPGSRYASDIALAPGPGGRLWVAWANNVPKIQALRTGQSGLSMGPVRQVGIPAGRDAIYSVAVDGASGRGNVVINVGDAFWHTQVIPGLTLQAAPTRWAHGRSKRVTFTVTDAGDKVAGARVAVGSRRCSTAANGRCAITFPASTRKGSLQARATRSGFAPGVRVLRVT